MGTLYNVMCRLINHIPLMGTLYNVMCRLINHKYTSDGDTI